MIFDFISSKGKKGKKIDPAQAAADAEEAAQEAAEEAAAAELEALETEHKQILKDCLTLELKVSNEEARLGDAFMFLSYFSRRTFENEILKLKLFFDVVI